MSRAAPGAARLVPLHFDGPTGRLEGLLQESRGHDHPLAAVVCHPHPLYGGTMHNKVVQRTAAVLHALGASVLRFNYRGVGESAGTFDRGEGELQDARAALAFLAARHRGARLWVAGFSFGAWVAARLAAAEVGVERLILIAPPVKDSSFEALERLATPKLILQGTADAVCPPELLREHFPRWAEPKESREIPGATHFFDRQLGALADVMHEALRAPASGATSSST